MAQRDLGNHGLTVSALGLGCAGMSQSYGPGDDSESVATIWRALELGINFFDTADVYGDGANEELLGRALLGERDNIVLATKFSLSRRNGESVINGRPEYVRASCEASLRRLQTDRIDLYYQHRVDPGTPIEDTIGAMGELVIAGKVRFLGLSEASVRSIRRAATVQPISALQSEWSLWTRDIEQEVLKAARECGIGVVPFSPLGRGFLTGAVTDPAEFSKGDVRLTHPRFQGSNLATNLSGVQKVQELAAEKKCSAGQLALAWVLAQGRDVVPIPGTKRSSHLEENVAATAIQLTAQDLEQLESSFPVGGTAGARYPHEYSYGDSPEDGPAK